MRPARQGAASTSLVLFPGTVLGRLTATEIAGDDVEGIDMAQVSSCPPAMLAL